MSIAVGRDPRDLPAYAVADAAKLLHVKTSTLRRWIRAQGDSPPVIVPVGGMFSFTNLIEAHVLDGLRRSHGVSMARVREGVQLLRNVLGVEHPLASDRFLTDGFDLFVKELGGEIVRAKGRQVVLRPGVERFLSRVEMSATGPVRFYPYTRVGDDDGPRVVVIDPRVSFGRPVVAGTGVPVGIIAGRFGAGESVAELAEDYGISPTAIEEAIRCRAASAA